MILNGAPYILRANIDILLKEIDERLYNSSTKDDINIDYQKWYINVKRNHLI